MTSHPYPSGHVTFLFTDIEGSTSRWESHREAMQQAVRQHDEILQASIEARGGYVFKTIGDAFCAAFASPLDAVLAALDAQRSLAACDFSDVGGLRVRMAIHAGQTDERGGDYFGPPVNRVARLLAAGHGGQVLVSGTVSDGVASQLPTGITLRSLGTLSLRDLKEPEHVHELVAPGLARVAKGLRALKTPPNNLPRVPSAFFGRHDDTMRVVEMLRQSPLATVVGAGGIGKTRLALEVASTMLDESSDGAWFVDLAPITDPSLVAGTTLLALGAPVSAGTPPIEQLVTYASNRSLLLVMDNCEHLVDEVAAIASAIVARCREAAILATSREALDIAGERVYHLSTLDLAASIELFSERAKAVNPRFVLDGANRSSVTDICKRLDGIALGVELAAARTRSIPVTELAKKLELRILSNGGRDRSARQQTMNALVGWSYDLLDAEEKALFRCLSVFAGGMTVDSVTAVQAAKGFDEWALLDLLASLTEKSLLVAEPADAPLRYRMLEPVREYALERLDDEGETSEARARHARGFAELTDRAYEEWDTRPAADWLVRQERELDNVRAALRWSLEERHDPETGARLAANAGPAFLRLSLLREGLRWGELALERAQGLRTEHLARLHYSLSMIHNNLGAEESALSNASIAASLYESAGDKRGCARALSQVAQQEGKAGRHDLASIASERALELAREVADPALLAAVLARAASSASAEEMDAARRWFQESVELFKADSRDADAARTLHWWSGREMLDGLPSEAGRLIDEALSLAASDLEMWTTSAASSIHWVLGNRDRAVPLIRRALALAGAAQHPILLPSMIAYVALVASDLEEAARLYGYACSRSGSDDHAPAEETVFREFRARLVDALGDERLQKAMREGSAWSYEYALARAQRI